MEIHTMLTIFAAGVTGGHDGKLGMMYFSGGNNRCRSKWSRDLGVFSIRFHIEPVLHCDETGHLSIRID